MIKFSIELELASKKTWSQEFATMTISTNDASFSKLLKRYFKVDKSITKISEKEYETIRVKLTHVVKHHWDFYKTMKMTVENEHRYYRLMLEFENSVSNNIRAILGDSSYSAVNFSDFF